MTSRTLRRLSHIALASIGLVVAAGIALSGATVATADTADRTLSLTREDGSPIGTLFTDWTMVPGDIVHTTVVAHRTGGGESSLMITLGDAVDGGKAAPRAVERDVLITVAANGLERTSSAADLMHADVIFDLGRSSAASVPIDVTFELPFSSGNDSQLQSLDLTLVVMAADLLDTTNPEGPHGTDGESESENGGGSQANPGDGSMFPGLPSTGASVTDALLVAVVATCVGLLLIGGRKRRADEVEHD